MIKTLLIPILIICTASAVAQAVDFYPARAEGLAQSLKGNWSFKYLPGNDVGADAGFSKPGFDVSSWKKISVPSNWELKGFAEPKYALEPVDGLGLYRRSFHVPAGWRDGDKTLLSHNAVISGLGNKGTAPETFIDADKTPRVSGSFTIILLENKWPEMLTRWFGKPRASKAFKPFHHSCNQ